MTRIVASLCFILTVAACGVASAAEPVTPDLPPWPEVIAAYHRHASEPLPPPDLDRQAGGPGVGGWAWTDHTSGFVHPPVLRFPAIDGAASYRLVIDGEEKIVGSTPVFDLAPVWQRMDGNKETILRVQALDAEGSPLGAAGERRVRRKVLLGGDAWPEVLDYRQSGLRCLRAVLAVQPEVKKLREEGRGSSIKGGTIKPQGGIIMTCAALAQATDDADERRDALALGEKQATMMLGNVFPPGSYLAGLPRANRTQDIAIWGGEALLDLHAASGDRRWLDAAIGIGDRYAAAMREEGWWPAYLDARSGEPVAEHADVACVGGYIIIFLERLVYEHDQEHLRPTLDKTVRWHLDNPVRTYLWEAQFDDMKHVGPYENLTGRDAVLLAQYLMRRGDDAGDRRIALDLMAFAADQFAFRKEGLGIYVKEQHHFGPVNQTMMRQAIGHAMAWRATGDPVQRALALEIANAVVKNQWDNGILNTYVSYEEDAAHTKWINCAAATARDLLSLADLLSME